MAEDASKKLVVRGNVWYHGSVISDRELQTFRAVVKCGAVGVRLAHAGTAQGRKKEPRLDPEE